MTMSWSVAVVLSLGALVAGCGGQEPATPPVQSDVAPGPTAPAASAASAATETAVASPAVTAPVAEETNASGTPEPEAPRAAPQASVKPAAPPAPTKPASAPGSGATAAMAPMPGTVIRATELKAEAALGARTLRTLAANTPVTITARQGGWLQVTSGEARGWVRLLHVSSQPSAGTSSARQELEAAARVATGRAGTGNVAVTTGIRGLDEKELREAKPNDEELKRLESLGAQPTDAEAHAKRLALERRQIPYPPPPQAR